MEYTEFLFRTPGFIIFLRREERFQMKDRQAGFIRKIFFIVSILSSFQSTGYAECFCETPAGSGCRRWGSGKAKFIWASSPDRGSGITLTAGRCGEGGEVATGYIFSSVDEICNGGNVCNDGYTSVEGCAVITVSGDQKALMNTLGLSFTSTMVCGYGSQYHPTVGISQTGVKYVLPVELPASKSW